MKKIIFFFIASLAIMVNGKLSAQQFIEGNVFERSKDGKEISLPGVNVYWAGTQTGTSTNVDGYFKLNYPESTNRNLVISYIGFKKDTITIGAKFKNPLKVILSSKQELDEVVIAQKAAGTHLSRAEPIVTQVITAAELCKAACCNLSESFETNASVDVANADAVSGAKQIKLLGLAGIYSQLMTENIPNLRGLSTPFGLGYVPSTWMESIQISKGAASVRNGYESITGQINTEYIKPNNGDLFNFNAYGNDYGKYETNIYSALKLNDKLSTVTFFHFEDLNQKSDKNKDGFMDDPLVSQLNLFNRWTYDAEKVHLKLGLKYLKEDREGGQLRFDKNRNRDINNGYGIGIKTNRYEAFTKAAYFFNESKTTSLGLVGSFIHHKQESFIGLHNYDAREDNFFGNLMFQTNLGNEENTLVIGSSFIVDNYDEQLNDSVFVKKESIPGTFLEYTYKKADKFTLILGLRSDFHNIYGTLFTPRVHLKYNLAKNTILRASAGKGFRSPNVIAENINLLASSRKLKVKEVPDIEEAWNYGINLTQYLDLFGREMTINVEFYRTSFINQLIIDRDQNITSIYVYNLDGKSYSNNFQIETAYELFRGMDVVLAARFNDVKTSFNGELLKKPLHSNFKGLINLSYATNLKKWQFDFTTQFNGKSRIPDTSGNPAEYRLAEYSPRYIIMNTQITKYFKKWDLYLGCENIGNYKQDNPILASDDPFGAYFDSSLIWGPVSGRKFYAGIRYRIKHKGN